ncbi:MAG: L,D-transpeptidase family protein [Candidatus Tantalella remota]|nr:L,D-transpeptidase family protein [Candidatus Tantalella remota]
MKKDTLYVIIAAVAALIITVVSLIALNSVPDPKNNVSALSKEKIMYEHGVQLAEEKKYTKGIAVFKVIVYKYSDTDSAEKSLRKIAEIYSEQGDYKDAQYYYELLLTRYPEIADSKEIRTKIGNLNVKRVETPAITGDSIEYVVQPGDTLTAISRKYKTTIELIKKINGLESDLIRIGQKLKVMVAEFSIFVDKAKNELILKKNGKPFKTYAVATGKNNSTPVGTFKVEERMVKPVWFKVGAVVSPESDEYELGDRWIGISAEGYGIHGTSDESTIGRQVTQGCVRMYNADVIELYDMVPSGTEVVIIDSAQVTEVPEVPEVAAEHSTVAAETAAE